jgi:hypothetical protein
MTTLLPLGSKSGSVFKVCYPIIRRSRRSHPARNTKRQGETGHPPHPVLRHKGEKPLVRSGLVKTKKSPRILCLNIHITTVLFILESPD